MFAIPALFSGPYAALAKWGTIILMLAAATAFSYYKGVMHEGQKLIDYKQAEQNADIRIAGVREHVTTKVLTEYLTVYVPKVEKQIQYVNREVVKYEAANLDRSTVSNAGVGLLNAAASPSEGIPATANATDGTPSGITTAEAIQSCTANYGICQRIRTQLIGLQEWITEQAKVK